MPFLHSRLSPFRSATSQSPITAAIYCSIGEREQQEIEAIQASAELHQQWHIQEPQRRNRPPTRELFRGAGRRYGAMPGWNLQLQSEPKGNLLLPWWSC